MPGEKLVEPVDGTTASQSIEDGGEIGLGIEIVELGALCRPPNYAERARFP